MSPSLRRRWNGTPFADEYATSWNACAADADSELRTITPAFVHAFTPWMDATRATIVKLPLTDRYAYCSASAVPHTSAPAPVTVKLPPLYVESPLAPTAPMSALVQPDGRPPDAVFTVTCTGADVVDAPPS